MKWKEMTTPFKILRVVLCLCCAAFVCLFAYEITGWFGVVEHWETGSIINDFLVDGLWILLGINDLKKNRGTAIFWIVLGSIGLVFEILFLFL